MATDIRFVNHLSRKVFTATGQSTERSTNKVPPTEFSWAVSNSLDPPDIEFKKTLIHPVFDQLLCGSCWAVAVATTMSDCLVVCAVVNFTPYISPTYFLSAYPQNQCQGGNPAELVRVVENSGAVDMSCIDYSWCSNDPFCTTRSSQSHFNENNLSSKIPDPGCYYEKNKYVYHIDKGSSEVVYASRQIPVNTLRSMVKMHIYNYGPVLSGFLILTNFTDGSFCDINGGVYFERADYASFSATGTLTFSSKTLHESNNIGGHAVSVVGWGVAKNIFFNNGKRGDVPYWHCRNSWGNHWGDNGYFKMAMYPFNKKVQFEKIILANIKNETYRFGGIVMFKATNKPKVRKLPEISDHYKSSIKTNRSEEFYTFDVIADGSDKDTTPPLIGFTPAVDKRRIVFLALFGLFLLVILVVVVIPA
jgi:hypothetical protein